MYISKVLVVLSAAILNVSRSGTSSLLVFIIFYIICHNAAMERWDSVHMNSYMALCGPLRQAKEWSANNHSLT